MQAAAGAAYAGKPESLMTEKICHEGFLCARGANVFPALRTSGAETVFFARGAQVFSRFSAHRRRSPKFCANGELRYTEILCIGHRHAVLRGMRRAQCGDYPRGAPVS